MSMAVPKTLKEWVLQVAHGDHLSADKMAEFTMLLWSSYYVAPDQKKNKLKPTKFPFEEIQIDFLGPIISEKGKKRLALIPTDNFSKWVWAKVMKFCPSKNVIEFLKDLIDSDGVPCSIKVDKAKAFKSAEFRKYSDSINLVVKFAMHMSTLP